MIRSLLIGSILLWPATSQAVCRVNCHQVVVQEQFIATAVAVPVAVPVASYAPVGYSYTPAAAQPKIEVHVHLDAAALRSAVLQEGPAAPAPPERPVLAAEAPVFSAVAQNCLDCHSPNGSSPKKAVALSHIDLSGNPTCEQKLAAVRAVLLEKMPPGKKLDPETAGKVLTELSK